MSHHIGIDIIEIARIEEAIIRWGERFLQRVFSESEIKTYRQKPSSLAARFAGKEAVIKALGTTVSGIKLSDIEILSHPGGQTVIHLHGQAKSRAEYLGLDKLAISLSHSRDYAIAMVTGDTEH